MRDYLTQVDSSIIEFVDALERHAERSTNFYDESFIDLILRYFPFKNIAITVYNDNFQYIGGIARNSAWNSGQYYNKIGLYKRDYMSRYVSNSYEWLEANQDIVLSSQVPAPDTKSAEEFRQFLEAGNLKYAAILPVDRDFRIIAYKSEQDGDFDSNEISLLKDLLIISRSKYQSFKNLKACHHLSKVKSTLLDHMQVGYITLNQDFFVLDCNAQAIESLAAMWGTTHVQDIVEKIRTTFPGLNLSNGQVECNGYILTTCAYSEIDYFGRIQQYYYFTFMHSVPEKKQLSGGVYQGGIPFSLLSAREMEVLDAFAHGLEYKEISKMLFISEGTVRTHLKSIYRKLDISNQRKLIYEYMKYIQP